MVQQQQTLETAATAMHLVETSALTGQGSEAAVFLPEPDASIDPGPPREDKTPLARSWQAVQDSFRCCCKVGAEWWSPWNDHGYGHLLGSSFSSRGHSVGGAQVTAATG